MLCIIALGIAVLFSQFGPDDFHILVASPNRFLQVSLWVFVLLLVVGVYDCLKIMIINDLIDKDGERNLAVSFHSNAQQTEQWYIFLLCTLTVAPQNPLHVLSKKLLSVAQPMDDE